ncbi:MAG: hypothetical protein WAM56_12860, partial [Acidobacteriaceae bacterium]
MRNVSLIRLWPRLVLAALIAVALPLAAQTAAGTATGKIHGHVNDPTGAALGSGTVALYFGGMASPTTPPKYT